jgi:hypothetical protein
MAGAIGRREQGRGDGLQAIGNFAGFFELSEVRVGGGEKSQCRRPMRKLVGRSDQRFSRVGVSPAKKVRNADAGQIGTVARVEPHGGAKMF